MKNKIKTLTDVPTFIIKRSKWSRGIHRISPFSRNKLLKHDGTMCCLGFYTKACGFSKKEILGIGSPHDIRDVMITRRSEKIRFKSRLVKYNRKKISTNTKICWNLMRINDDPEISEKDRELKIFKAFNKIGVKVRFTK